MERTHEEIEELLGAYALDAVDGEERRAVEAHLQDCPRCAAEVADHREVAAMMAYTGAPAPDGLWDRIVETLEEPPPAMNVPVSRPAGEGSGTATDLSAWRERRRWLPLSAAAAALVVVGLIGGVLIGNLDSSDQQVPGVAAPSLADIARQVLNDPASSKVTLESDDATSRATAAIDVDGSGYLLGTSLPALDESQTYQLWGIRDDAVISLGVLGPSPDVVAFHLDDTITTLAITAEVVGGVPQSSNEAVVVGEVA